MLNRKIAVAAVMIVFILVSVRMVQAGIPATGSCSDLWSADELWRLGKFYESHETLTRLADNFQLAAEDRVGVLQRLALQSWLLSGNADSALTLLNRAVQLHEARASSYTMMSRFLLENGNADSAISVSLSALRECRWFSDSLRAVFAFGRAVFECQKEAYRAGKAMDLRTLRDAAARLNAVGLQAPSETYLWELSLGLSLLLKDGPSIREAWMQYLELSPEDSLFTMARDSFQVLAKALPSWTGNDLDRESRRALIRALAQSRLYRYAKLMVASPALPYGDELRREPEIAGILDYADLIERASRLIPQIFRKRLTADSTIAADIQEVLGLAYNYWQSLKYPGERPEFTTDELGAQLSQRWGAAFCSVDFGPAAFDMTWGHVVREDVREVEQYGHKVEVRVTIVDQMVSSCMMEWLTDGDVQIGGWAPIPPIVYQVRPASFTSSIKGWEKFACVEKRQNMETRINDLRAADDSLAKADPYAYLPGTDMRIRYSTLKRLYDSLASSGYAGERLRRAFFHEYERLKEESAIIAHEGRHLIDMTYYSDEFESWDATRVELSAKLSEVLFSPNPRFSVGNTAAVFCEHVTGDASSGHGPASYLIRKGLVAWMDQHADEINGFDRLCPTLPQLDLLSTAQLLTALRTLDPSAQSSE